MSGSLRPLLLSALVLAFAFVTGCAAPCDRYCDEAANYIEFCLETGSQGEWVEAGDWSIWGAGGKDEYLADCRSDLAAQLDGPGDRSAIGSACEDDANRYQELEERGLCADLP